jgi:endonuclease/exonuclease/phosphatase family metal-dependent hydrolase
VELSTRIRAPDFLQAEHFLDLRLGLKHEILRTPTAPKDYSTATSAPFGREHESGGFVHVNRWIHPQFVPSKFNAGDVKLTRLPDERIADRDVAVIKAKTPCEPCQIQSFHLKVGSSIRTA